MSVENLLPSDIDSFINSLPDPASARVFWERLTEEHPPIAAQILPNQELLVHLLTISAYSPLLSETILQRPEYVQWLARERDLAQIKSKDDLLQDLARFLAMNSTLPLATVLARFKRRELLRIYLRDCLKLATLSETTAELSYLADAILEQALQQGYQPLLARYGKPQSQDERGRIIGAEFAIIGLGKLGSYELNYSSDIDLVFIYSADGETAGPERVPNRLFFTKLGESVVKTVGTPLTEGAVFRIDLRLRPRGREGALVVPLVEMLRYYRDEAQSWERQALVRARASAGNLALVEQFQHQIQDQIYYPQPLKAALQDVRRAKEKIDSQNASRLGGYNVKLGKGGIREIEFIVQALQICYGGQEHWLRTPQTLIGLQRLSDKGLISDNEHTRLALAYQFLRMVEHRLQMEHGLQTHSLPLMTEKLALLARRCGYSTYAQFDHELQNHCHNVNTIYSRVFDLADTQTEAQVLAAMPIIPSSVVIPSEIPHTDIAPLDKLLNEVVAALVALPTTLTEADIAQAVAQSLSSTLNPARALRRVRDVALSSATEEHLESETGLTVAQISELTTICGASHYFAQLFISYPWLAKCLSGPLPTLAETFTPETIYQQFAQVTQDLSLDEAAAKLRTAWHIQLIKIGRYDLLSSATNRTEATEQLRIVNLAQTALAEAALKIASECACHHLLKSYPRTDIPLCYTFLALGRLGHCGLDYNSDLDLIFVYGDAAGEVVTGLTNQEFYARLVELTIQFLSALKREGILYQVDMRLRPDGRNGLLATKFENLPNYLSERAAIWELMAYLKLRPVVGDPQFGQQVAELVLEVIWARSQQYASTLASEVVQMRTRLEKQKSQSEDFKFGVGGMLDVYFATRYLQLCHKVADPLERGTLALITYLQTKQLLSLSQAEKLSQGYNFLRQLDHQIRLQLERVQTSLPQSSLQRADLARALKVENEGELLSTYRQHLADIRTTYLEIINTK